MIISRIQGGLGNQMFQYSIGKILEQKFGNVLYLDIEYFNDQIKKRGFTPRKFELNIFNNDINYANQEMINSFLNQSLINKTKRLFNLPNKKIHIEEKFKFDNTLFSNFPPIYISGYFQSEKYFIDKKSYIKNIFSFPKVAIEENSTLLNEIYNTNSVSVHFRRGDYVTDEITNQFHGTCQLEYYFRAFELMSRKLGSPKFYIFSDDIDWVKKSICHWDYNIFFVQNISDKNWNDMFVMSQCKHNIIANSSYSWWSAWLNDNKDKIVIAPKIWFNHQDYIIDDIVPQTWIKL